MAFFARFLLLFGFLTLLPFAVVSGQVLSDPSSRGTRDSRNPPTSSGGSEREETFRPGIIIGGGSPFQYPSRNDDRAASPGGEGGSDRSGSSRGTYGGGAGMPYTDDDWLLEPGLTREEIVRRRAEIARQQRLQYDARRRRALLEEDISRTLRSFLPDEPEGYKPRQFLRTPVPTPLDPGAVPRNDEPPTDTRPRGGAPTAETQEAKTLEGRRRQVETMPDGEEKERELAALKRREEERERMIARRKEAERGSIPFEIAPELKFTASELSEGWCRLFDGQTLFGWRTQSEGPYGGGRFTVENGEIHSDPRHPGLLYTTNQFGDATVSFEYLAEENSEAFLLLRSSPSPRDIKSSCYAISLQSDNFLMPRGMILGRIRLSEDQLRTQEKSGTSGNEWCKITAQFDGSQLRVNINQDEPTIFFDSKPLGYGYVGLLVTKGKVRFRNMKWLPGSSLPILDALSPTTHWRPLVKEVAVKPTRSAAVQMTGGPGVLESRDLFDNFVLQFEYNILYSSAKTGVYFRAPPRQPESGYLVALQNSPTRQDRDTTVGVDAGSFTGRKQGRFVRPEDQAWNSLTLVVVDRQFQTWINGIPVCEMSDRRPPAPDVQSGYRAEAGTIQLWAPNDMTNVQFRNIRVVPILPRFEKSKTLDDHNKSSWEEVGRQRKQDAADKRMDAEVSGER